jgi:putative RecB family exonuclease
MPVYSNSRIGTYENCPQQYKLSYVDKIKLPEEQEGVEAFLGSRVHETLEKLYKDMKYTKVNSLGELIGYYKSLWDKDWHENVVIVKKDYTKDHYFNTGIDAIVNYYKRYYPFNHAKTLATEYRLSFKIDDYAMQGYIDRLDYRGNGVYEVHDYKTSGSLPSQDRVDSDRQLALYQIGVKEAYKDAKDIRLIWHYLVFDKELTSSRTDAQLKDLKKEVVSLIKTIEKDTVYEPRESSLCDWCGFYEYCPAKKHEVKVSALPKRQYLADTGVSLVNKYAAIKESIAELQGKEAELQAELEDIGQRAIEYARQKGISNIAGDKYILKIKETEDLKFPGAGEEGREALEAFVKGKGIWDELSTLNIRGLAKDVQEEKFDKKITTGLMKFGTTEKAVEVRLMKKKEEE